MSLPQLTIENSYNITMNEEKLLVMHICIESEVLERHFFVIQSNDRFFVIAKAYLDGMILWLGYNSSKWNECMCRELEQLIQHSLPPLPDINPFECTGGVLGDITTFYIDNIKVEKAKAPFEEVEAIYYRVHTSIHTTITVVNGRLPLNVHWEWWPASKMDDMDFKFSVEMIAEYENGTYAANLKINEDLVNLLQAVKQQKE